ncbi:MAG: tRNA glutamyl-Q(34) synthetase GluQRS [Proteobacteria bacterium]|nr:tRNA glutamyl-Q(34) synthetase GluQRS [Pseudomonadota bacterium]
MPAHCGAGTSPYVGRFAPSPTGLLHAGSLAAALASWLDARAHGGRWLVRIEDVDTPRCVAGAADGILAQLAALGLAPDEPPWWQSARSEAYAQALAALQHAGLAYPCGCSRKAVGDGPYPGTCRNGLHGKPARAWRLRVPDGPLRWHDARLGAQEQDVARAVGDFVIRRADGLWAYQLAVVVDDAAQGITHVVRGEDLADNTPRQMLLQRALGLPTPAYRHTPLVLAADGCKLSKQNGAAPLDLTQPQLALAAAGAVLGLPALAAATLPDWLAAAVSAWRDATRARP